MLDLNRGRLTPGPGGLMTAPSALPAPLGKKQISVLLLFPTWENGSPVALPCPWPHHPAVSLCHSGQGGEVSTAGQRGAAGAGGCIWYLLCVGTGIRSGFHGAGSQASGTGEGAAPQERTGAASVHPPSSGKEGAEKWIVSPGPGEGGARTIHREERELMPGPQGAGGAPAMSLGKLSPVGWVSGSQGKRRLTADMISPPLGDFRHTMHVGRGGDVFGDTSFLSNHGGSSGSTHRSPRSFLAKKLQQLNQAAYDSLVVGKLTFDRNPASSTDGHSGYGPDSGFCTISRLPRPEKPRDRERDSAFPSEPELRRSDSLLSFRLDLDLGPSLLSELLGVMSLSEASAAETTPAPASSSPAPASSSPAPAARPPAPASNPQPRGHCPNGVTAGLSPLAEVRASVVGECPRVPADTAPSRHWGAGWGGGQGSHRYTEIDARQELAGVLPQARASWESLDEEWGAPQAGSRAPVPSTVQANTFEFADAEEDDEVKV
uniref:CRIB domain-containing protein n=2 Tax=Felis catus TaxID=9685 RepID=A0ABI7ZFN0_FELCA